MNAHELIRHFDKLFGQRPRIFRAPGRVNLIGEHTDYNDGFVMPGGVRRLDLRSHRASTRSKAEDPIRGISPAISSSMWTIYLNSASVHGVIMSSA